MFSQCLFWHTGHDFLIVVTINQMSNCFAYAIVHITLQAKVKWLKKEILGRNWKMCGLLAVHPSMLWYWLIFFFFRKRHTKYSESIATYWTLFFADYACWDWWCITTKTSTLQLGSLTRYQPKHGASWELNDRGWKGNIWCSGPQPWEDQPLKKRQEELE